MKKIIKLSVLFFASALVLASCSKYDDNPAVSLKSKNGRIVGEWTLTKAEQKLITQEHIHRMETTNTETMTYDGVIMTETSGGYTSTYSYSEKMKINNDGTVEITVVDDGDTEIETDIWSWIDGTSNKELIMIGGIGGSDIFSIKKLTNKELVLGLSYSNSYTYDGRTSSSSVIATLTYEKK